MQAPLIVNLRKRVRLNVENVQSATLTFTFNKEGNTYFSLSLLDKLKGTHEKVSTEEYDAGICSLSLGLTSVSLSDFEIGLTCVSQDSAGSIDIADVELELFDDKGYFPPVIDQHLYFQVELPINNQDLIDSNEHNLFSVQLRGAQQIFEHDKLFVLNKKH